MNTNEIIQCSNLQRTFGKTVALNGIDLTIGRGRIVGLAAPNAAGKTTLIKECLKKQPKQLICWMLIF